MPAVIVRRRLGRRSVALGHRLTRWYWRNRPQIAMTVAFVVAGLLGLVAVALERQALSARAASRIAVNRSDGFGAFP